jgi:acyl dehydratase
MSVPGLEALPGTTLPEGSFTITEEENRRLGAVLGSSGEATVAHPVWAYIATQRGIGISVADLCSLADFDVNDGPMLGSVEMDYGAPLAIGVTYRVTGEVLGIERKHGRKTGTFDIMTYRERLIAPDGAEVASSTNTFILPRRDA